MNSIPTNTSTPALDAVLIATDERKAFWRHYQEWVCNASDAELVQLQSALETFDSFEVQSLASVIRQVLHDEVQKRRFPASFLEPLQAANWPGAAANG